MLILAYFWPYKFRIKIFSKNKNVTFFTTSYKYVPKIGTTLWTGFEISTERKNEQTDERMIGGQSISPNRVSGDQNSSKSDALFFRKRGILDMLWRTNEQTNARTNLNPEASAAEAERPKCY